MKPHALDPARSQRRERPFVLEPAERALDGRATTVEPLPSQGVSRDQGMQPFGLDRDGRGSAFPGWAAPLCCLALRVRFSACRRSRALTGRGLCSPRLTRGGFPYADHGPHVTVLATCRRSGRGRTPCPIAHVSGTNPRPFSLSSSGPTVVDSLTRPVSTRHASGRAVFAHYVVRLIMLSGRVFSFVCAVGRWAAEHNQSDCRNARSVSLDPGVAPCSMLLGSRRSSRARVVLDTGFLSRPSASTACWARASVPSP